MIRIRGRTPILITGANLQLVSLMGGISKDKTLHRHGFQVVPGYHLRQGNLILSIFYQKGRNHREVGIRADTILIAIHGTVAFKGTTRLTHGVRRSTILPIIFQVLGKLGQHVHQVVLHLCFSHKQIVDNAFCRTCHFRFGWIFRLNIRIGYLIKMHIIDRDTTTSRYPIYHDTYIYISSFTHRELNFLGTPIHRGKTRRRTFRETSRHALASGEERIRRSSTTIISRTHIRRQLIFSGRKILKSLLQSGRTRSPTLSEIICLLTIGDGGHLAKVVVCITIFSNQQAGYRRSTHRPTGWSCNLISTKTISRIIHSIAA